MACPVELFVPAANEEGPPLDAGVRVADSLAAYGIPLRLVVPGEPDDVSQAYSKFLTNSPDIVEPKHLAAAALWF
jgi:hypothetical protein